MVVLFLKILGVIVMLSDFIFLFIFSNIHGR